MYGKIDTLREEREQMYVGYIPWEVSSLPSETLQAVETKCLQLSVLTRPLFFSHQCNVLLQSFSFFQIDI